MKSKGNRDSAARGKFRLMLNGNICELYRNPYGKWSGVALKLIVAFVHHLLAYRKIEPTQRFSFEGKPPVKLTNKKKNCWISGGEASIYARPLSSTVSRVFDHGNP